MAIPPFDSILNILPPHLGDPSKIGELSPYQSTMPEVCARFMTTTARKTILGGFLNLRRELFDLRIHGFQWIGGSFMENIEVQESRDPKDIDVVTFVEDPIAPTDLYTRVAPKPELLSRSHVKATYFVDHFLLSAGSPPRIVIDNSRYWYGLFSHRRDGEWKGMLFVDLQNESDDHAARLAMAGVSP